MKSTVTFAKKIDAHGRTNQDEVAFDCDGYKVSLVWNSGSVTFEVDGGATAPTAPEQVLSR